MHMVCPDSEVGVLVAWVMGVIIVILVAFAVLVLVLFAIVVESLKQKLVIKLYKMAIRSNSKLGTEIWLYTRKSLDKDDLTFYGG